MVNVETWQVVHEELVGIAKRRAALDVEEARWIRRGIDVEVWKPFGMVNIIDYLERVVGYAPRTAMDRVRVAVELKTLKGVERAMERGEMGYSAAREIVRVATCETEEAWVEAARAKNVKEVEDMVRGRQKGARPEDPEEPSVVMKRLIVEVPPEVFARWRQVCAEVSDDSGRRLEDGEVFALMCEAALGGSAERSPRSQVAITVCEKCKAGWQAGGGVNVPISEAAIECARCDALEIGALDADWPERASSTITPAIRRFVWHRDGGRCRVPGCRSTKHIDIHHLIHQAGGQSTNDPNFLVLACRSCHVAHHEGRIRISGTSDNLRVDRPELDRACAAHANDRHGTKRVAHVSTGRDHEAQDRQSPLTDRYLRVPPPPRTLSDEKS